jgi:hypothetical protein
VAAPTEGDSFDDRPARPRASRRRRLVLLPVVVLAAVVAVLVIQRLPPSAGVEADARDAIADYEVATEPAWPSGVTVGQPLTATRQQALARSLRDEVAETAAGAALEAYDADAAAATFVANYELDPTHVVTRWKGEVVYFDFVRHTQPTGLIVRAGVLKGHRLARVNAEQGRVFGARWMWPSEVQIKEYELREVDGRWRVVESQPWGTCDAEGENVVEGDEL